MQQQRKVEVFRDDSWVETDFSAIQVGDVFRLWEPVTERNETLQADVFAWKCESPPETIDHVMGCRCSPAMTVPLPVDQDHGESPDQKGG